MSGEKDISCISDIGALLQMLGGVIILASQAINIIQYLSVLNYLPSFNPDDLPFVEFFLLILRINIGVAILFASLIIFAGVIALWKSGPIGGLLSIIFAVPSFVVIGIIYYAGPILAIIGGILSIAPGIRRPKPKTKRPYK